MKLKHKCDICNNSQSIVWSLKKGIPPNYYLKEPFTEKVSKQDIFFCEQCNTITNIHEFSFDDLFSNYVYRTPDTSMDEEVVTFLTSFINEKKIKNMIEIAGNNGVFAEKVIRKLEKRDFEVTILDKVRLATKNKQIKHINDYLTKDSAELLNNINSDFVIVRHALAHNNSVKNFFLNIVDAIRPKYIYIENASLLSTYKKKDYSQFYSEHYFQLSPHSIIWLGKLSGYSPIEIKDFDIHNGSFGILLVNESTNFQIEHKFLSKDAIQDSIYDWISSVHKFWTNLSLDNKKLIIWGCSAKFLFTYSALELEKIFPISLIIDSTPEKNGLYAPGTSIKVQDEDKYINNIEDYVFVIGARNFEHFIKPKILKKYPGANIFCPPF